jgi:hypothetical protein
LSRKGPSPFRQVEGACDARFGQRRNRPVIHVRAECQWTRVDNSTVHRKRTKIFPFAPQRAAFSRPLAGCPFAPEASGARH